MSVNRTLFLSPHNLDDDEVLFGAYTLLRERPSVVVCYWGTTQSEGLGATRVLETEAALEVLGIDDFRQWFIPDSQANAGILEERLRALGQDWDMVFAPMVEDGGHEQHNLVGELAREVFSRVQGYATYRRGSGRTQTSNEVGFAPEWPALKLKAMACYESQIRIANTRPWFFDDDAYREWYE